MGTETWIGISSNDRIKYTVRLHVKGMIILLKTEIRKLLELSITDLANLVSPQCRTFICIDTLFLIGRELIP